MSNETLLAFKELIHTPGLLKEIYGDLGKPGISQVGKALGAILGLGNTILWPIILLNEKSKIALQNNLEKFRKQLMTIPEEKIYRVPPELGVPIVEKVSYVTDEQLSSLYINLLAKASSANFSHFAHPSFVNVINNLSPDEALLLRYFKDDLPFIEARFQETKGLKFQIAERLLTGLEMKVKLLFPENIVAYFSNFEGLGLINIRRDLAIDDDCQYKKLEEAYRLKIEKIQHDEINTKLIFVKGEIELTPFGNMFLSACLSQGDNGHEGQL